MFTGEVPPCWLRVGAGQSHSYECCVRITCVSTNMIFHLHISLMLWTTLLHETFMCSGFSSGAFQTFRFAFIVDELCIHF